MIGAAADLLSAYMDRLELRVDSTEESFRAASTVYLLLKQFPGDMDKAFQLDMVEFLQTVLAPRVTALR